jgi:hypothetical protein
VQFFFEDLSGSAAAGGSGFAERDNAPYVMDFVSSAEGLELNRSYSRILDPRVRKKILELIRCLGDETAPHEIVSGASGKDSGNDGEDAGDNGDDDEDGLEAEAAAKHA